MGKVHFGIYLTSYCGRKDKKTPVSEKTLNIQHVTCKSCLMRIAADLKIAKRKVRRSESGKN